MIVHAAADLRARRTTAARLLDTALAAIDRHDRRTNAFVHVDRDRARRSAELADEELAQGLDRGPLHGIPISLKDLIDVAGDVTTAGSKVLRDRVAPVDATVVTLLRRAGAVLIGKTNMHEFALGTTSEDSAFGPVRHPSDSSRVAGGSSGGSAVAVATGMGLVSIGSDTGGSIRIPAAACGVVGLKPAFGEVPTDGVIPLSPSLDHVGPLTLCVQDAAWVWAVLSGRTPTSLQDVAAARLRLRHLGGYFAAPLAPEVRQAFDAALASLGGHGVSVFDGEIAGTSGIAEIYVNVVLPEAAAWHASLLHSRAADYTPPVRMRLEAGRTISQSAYETACRARATLARAVDAALLECDALVLPTLPIVAPRLGETEISIDPRQNDRTPLRSAMLRQTQLFNLTGHPAVSLPIRSTGLPVGLQLVGRRNDTAGLLAIAAACERILAAGDDERGQARLGC